MKDKSVLLLIIVLVFVLSIPCAASGVRPRVVILTDAETDDRCSMVHALLYANDMDIAAIIQTNSCFQRHGWSSEPWLRDMIDAYGKVLSNLRVHDKRYPSAEYLHSVTYIGDEDPHTSPTSVRRTRTSSRARMSVSTRRSGQTPQALTVLSNCF